MTQPQDDDWIAAVKRDDKRKAAAEAARQRAVAAPRPKRTSAAEAKADAVKSYVRQALSNEIFQVQSAPKGIRNHRLFVAAANLAGLVHTGALDEPAIKSQLMAAAKFCGLLDDPDDGPETCRKTIESGIRKGRDNPRDMTGVGTMTAPDPNVVEVEVISGGQRQGRKALPANDIDDEPVRSITLTPISSVKSIVPQWVWHQDDLGLIQLGKLVLFAGRPGTGKSTAARWLAALISRGQLPGAWHGQPMNIGLACFEEDLETAVVTSLDAVNADRTRVFNIKATDERIGGGETGMQVLPDEALIIEQCLSAQIRCLIVDPVMSTFSDGSDPNSQLDVRKHLTAYQRIAKAINGIVIGIAHLRKPSQNQNRGSDGILSEITGSSAWGEVVRSAMAFAVVDPAQGKRLMQIVKNSNGPVGAAWEYQLAPIEVETDDGLSFETTAFELQGRSLMSIDDYQADAEPEYMTLNMEILNTYLEANQPAPRKDIVKALVPGEMSLNQLNYAKRKLGVVHHSMPTQGDPSAPHQKAWHLPGAYCQHKECQQ